MKNSTLPSKLLLALTLGASLLIATSAQASAILFIDDDKGQNGQGAWLSALGALGQTVSYEAISADGSPVSNLSAYDAVIWSNGDAAYSNLTAANVTTLTNYLNSGGRLMYGGGHSLYQENNAQSFIQNYLGLSNYQYNMPMFNSCGGSATSTGTIGPVSMVCSSTGTYHDMLTAFSVNLPTATELLALSTGFNNFSAASDSIAALNVANGYRALTLGFDINHVAASDRTRFVGASLDSLFGNTVPEPASLSLFGLALVAMATLRRRRSA